MNPMYHVVCAFEGSESTITALEYQRLLRKPESEQVIAIDGVDVPLKDCQLYEKASPLGSYVLHVARKHGWTTVTIAGEAAHLLDILIDEDTFLHGGVPNFGTLLRQASDPLTLDQEVMRVDNLQAETLALVDTGAGPVLREVLSSLRTKFPLASPSKTEGVKQLTAAIEAATDRNPQQLVRDLRKLVKKHWPQTESPSDSEAEV